MGFFDSDYNKGQAEKLLQNRTVINAMNKEKKLDGAFVSSFQSNYLFCPNLCKTCKNLDIHISDTATPIWCRTQTRDSASELSKYNSLKQYDQCSGYCQCTTDYNNFGTTGFESVKSESTSFNSFASKSDIFSVMAKAHDTKLPEYVIANNINDFFINLSENKYFSKKDSEIIRNKMKLFLSQPEYKNNIKWTYTNGREIAIYVESKSITFSALEKLNNILEHKYNEVKLGKTGLKVLYGTLYVFLFCIGLACGIVGISEDDPIWTLGLLLNVFMIIFSIFKTKRKNKIKDKISSENKAVFDELIK